MDKKKLEELQVYEQNLQNILLQKQFLQTELNEINNAIEELEKLEGNEAFRIVGGIMIKKNKEELKKELKEKKGLIELRIKSFEKQEEIIKKKVDEIREEILKKLKK